MRRVTLIITLAIGIAIAIGIAGPVQTQNAIDRNAPADSNSRLTAALDAKADRIFHRALQRLEAAETSADTNVRTGAKAGAAQPTAVGDLCAIAVVPGPAGNFNIRFGIFNVASSSVDFTIMDSFHALGERSLLHESVFSTAAPVGGSINVLYPSGAPGKGPVVLGYTSFDMFESVSFNTDPDTYDDPAFGATVQELDNTVFELVYSGALRCAGRLQFNPALNASIAFITQTSPAP
jgi:hypothetical protein